MNQYIVSPAKVPIFSHKLTPQLANTAEMDPIIRKKLFPLKKLIPFDDFVRRELRLQKAVHTPRKDMKNPPESWKSWKV